MQGASWLISGTLL